jgi:hypothetical protein
MYIFYLKSLRPAKHDCTESMVVVASSLHDAREWASKNCTDEGPNVWLNPRKSTCHILGPCNNLQYRYQHILIRDVNWG